MGKRLNRRHRTLVRGLRASESVFTYIEYRHVRFCRAKVCIYLAGHQIVLSSLTGAAYFTYVALLNQVVMMGTQLYHDACVPQHHKYCAHQIALLYVSWGLSSDSVHIAQCCLPFLARSAMPEYASRGNKADTQTG